MSRTIWKYPLKLTDEQTLRIPAPELLSVAMQNGVLCLWAAVTPDARPETEVVVRICGTGNPGAPTATSWQFLGSVFDRVFVWHVFARKVTQ